MITTEASLINLRTEQAEKVRQQVQDELNRDGGTAFPCFIAVPGGAMTCTGMSIREYAAIHCLQGLFAVPATDEDEGSIDGDDTDGYGHKDWLVKLPEAAVRYADNLLAELKRTSGQPPMAEAAEENPEPKNLKWDNHGLRWVAESSQKDSDRVADYYSIELDPDTGRFDVNVSDDNLFDEEQMTFTTLDDAKECCQENENNLGK